MSDEATYFYGINGTRGGYLVPPLEPTSPEAEPSALAPEAEAPDLAASEPAPVATAAPPAGRRYRSFDPNDPRFKRPDRKKHFRYWVEGVEPHKLESAGWAAIFPQNVDPAIVDALQPLLRLRGCQATAKSAIRYRLCMHAEGYRRDDTVESFLKRRGVGAGAADPDEFPYYVLIVGPPTAVPYSFQYDLDSQYAVGRLCFDTPAEYAAYARSVVEMELQPRRTSSDVAFFATEHVGDVATERSARHLAQAQADKLRTSDPTCTVRLYRGEQATKARALSLLGGNSKPALLFTATHGLGFARGDARQRTAQGAILCQEPSSHTVLSLSHAADRDSYIEAEDIADDADVSGLIAFFFGCYTAGTPKGGGAMASYLPDDMQAAEEVVARLPQRLLSHPRGSALAVVGHIDRAWSLSFWSPRTKAQTSTFASVIRHIVHGAPVGLALEDFGARANQIARYALSDGSKPRQDYEDARNYVLLGDPAVRLPPPKRRFRSWEPPPPR